MQERIREGLENYLSGRLPESSRAEFDEFLRQNPLERAMVEEFRARRQLIVDGLNSIPGFRCRMPHGAFYVFPNVAGTGMNGSEMADKLLYDGGVCTLSGTAFGKVGKDHIRISYANSQANLTEALGRIRALVEPLVAARV